MTKTSKKAQLSLQYLAGFMDGEGCINLTVRGKYHQVSLRVLIVNCDPGILLKIQQQFGGYLSKPTQKKKGWKMFRRLTIVGEEAMSFIDAIYPYLVVKKQQADLARDFWEFSHRPTKERCNRGARRFGRTPETLKTELEFKDRLHVLNRKGA